TVGGSPAGRSSVRDQRNFLVAVVRPKGKSSVKEKSDDFRLVFRPEGLQLSTGEISWQRQKPQKAKAR
ncbi:MAG: hypothetical protein ABIU84_05515, partial [Thermoanaerobaculia bacterium]